LRPTGHNGQKDQNGLLQEKSMKFDLSSVEIYLDGVWLNFDEEASFLILGITVDSHLTWESHSNKVANKLAKNSSINSQRNTITIWASSH
jgi:hypothetical protein